ncbi:hypothetical protein ACA910_008023 [Epithemia clementina (nom. ined.)]
MGPISPHHQDNANADANGGDGRSAGAVVVAVRTTTKTDAVVSRRSNKRLPKRHGDSKLFFLLIGVLFVFISAVLLVSWHHAAVGNAAMPKTTGLVPSCEPNKGGGGGGGGSSSGGTLSLSSSSPQRPKQEIKQEDDHHQDQVLMTHFEESNHPSSNRLVILPGELPGYTGWARPVHSLVDHYRLDRVSPSSSTRRRRVGQAVRIVVTCPVRQCAHGGAWFYTRAYGPALLPATTLDHGNGTYTFSIYPHDPGMYHVEIVLAFSKTINMTQVPMDGRLGEPSFEGFLLPGFPISFAVVDDDNNNNNNKNNGAKTTNKVPGPAKKICHSNQILQRSDDYPLTFARWVVTSRTRHNAFSLRDLMVPKGTNPNKKLTSLAKYENISLEGYQYSDNSVGFHMDYVPNSCDIQSLSNLTKVRTWTNAIQTSKLQISQTSKIHFLFFGDSNIRNQYNFFRDHVYKSLLRQDPNGVVRLFNFSYVDVMKFWDDTWEKSKEHFVSITGQFPNDHFIVVYNLGLHDLNNRCTLFGQATGRVSATAGPCLPYYKDDVTTMTRLVASTPSLVKLWQSTTAGWHKWGVYGVAWPQKQGQKFPKDPNMCHYFNQVAWDVVKEHDMQVMDTFWLTLPRADHREVIDRDASRTSYKLVHFGPEVYSSLVRQILMIALEAIKNGKPGKQYV